MLILAKPSAEQHSLIEDVQGIVVGATLVALSVQFLNAAGLFTGQIAGLAIIGASFSTWSFGALFFVMNLPFLRSQSFSWDGGSRSRASLRFR